MRIVLAGLLLVLSCPTWSRQDPAPASEDEEAAYTSLLFEGRRALEAGKPDEAIAEFDKVLSAFEARYDGSDTQYYCARTPEESLVYLLTAASNERNTEVLSNTWAAAHFLKGYALVDLGRLAEARASIEQAMALSPQNSQYLSEMGHIYQLEQDWDTALQYFQNAEGAAEFSPPEAKAWELGVARRGTGYVLIELGRLDEAEEIYLKCIEEDPGDAKARNELDYIRRLRTGH